MVLSDMPFERSKLIHSRYSMLRRPDSAPLPAEVNARDKQSKEYAAFLKYIVLQLSCLYIQKLFYNDMFVYCEISYPFLYLILRLI